MKTSIGGDRLGSGNKMNVNLKEYKRSTHDLGYTWRSSMAAGTLVPFMKYLALPGDTFTIDLEADCMTLPTLGPLFGSFKLQLDVFRVPIRLYNHRLHMNELGIGMNMSDVKLPLVQVRQYATDIDSDERLEDNAQVNPSSLMKYLGVSGLGRYTGADVIFHRYFNAVPLLAYWDIFKNYYANKQEDQAYVIHTDSNTSFVVLNGASLYYTADPVPKMGLNQTVTVDETKIDYLRLFFDAAADEPDPTDVQITRGGAVTTLDTVFQDFEWDGAFLVCRNVNSPTASSEWRVSRQNVNVIDPLKKQNISLVPFNLSVIDDMRKSILRWDQDTSPFTITASNERPYRVHLEAVNGSDPVLRRTSIYYPQEGLAVKTYQSDLFNNWISTEWIDGPNGVNEITRIDTSGGSFTIDTLNLAKKVYIMLNRIAISGGTYDDWLDAVYTHERRKGTESPVYEGSLIREVSFQEVVSNSKYETGDETQPLGTLAGRGRLTNKKKGGRVVIRCDEHSYIMGIVSLTPRIDYSTGNDFDMSYYRNFDDFHVPQLDAIGYQDLVTEIIDWRDTELPDNDAPVYNSVGKQPAWIDYMTAVNRCYGNFADREKEMFMTLNRRYDATDTGIADLTTYIDPSKFNQIFALADLSAQNFWVQIAVNTQARRKMSAKVIPNL